MHNVDRAVVMIGVTEVVIVAIGEIEVVVAAIEVETHVPRCVEDPVGLLAVGHHEAKVVVHNSLLSKCSVVLTPIMMVSSSQTNWKDCLAHFEIRLNVLALI